MDKELERIFPEDWRKEFSGLSGDNVSTALSEHRTVLSNARSHMSNERTHLSYLRTSLSLLTFGITLNRFSIYLRQNKTMPKVHTTLYETQYVGLGMVLLGLGILIWALYHFRKTARDIDNFTFVSAQKPISILTLAIILIGGFSAIWMIANQLPGD